LPAGKANFFKNSCSSKKEENQTIPQGNADKQQAGSVKKDVPSQKNEKLYQCESKRGLIIFRTGFFFLFVVG
jgi:hypothetical protein